jgi:CDP-diglyceride synthetase
LGDITESYFKRRFGVKDSNDFIVQANTPVLKQIEGLLGGRNGHGGFYDRLDSLSLVLAVYTLISLAS